MISAQVGPEEIELSYDALDRTVTRTAGEEETIFAYAGEAEDLAYERTGEEETLYAHGPGGPLAQKTGAGVHYLLRDAHTDVVGLVGATGMEGTASYSPWGEVREATGASSSLGFQGQMTDPTTGLVDMTACNYHPGLGRFTTRDEVFGNRPEPITLNQFLYAEAAPVTHTDHLGLCVGASMDGWCSYLVPRRGPSAGNRRPGPPLLRGPRGQFHRPKPRFRPTPKPPKPLKFRATAAVREQGAKVRPLALRPADPSVKPKVLTEPSIEPKVPGPQYTPKSTPSPQPPPREEKKKSGKGTGAGLVCQGGFMLVTLVTGGLGFWPNLIISSTACGLVAESA